MQPFSRKKQSHIEYQINQLLALIALQNVTEFGPRVIILGGFPWKERAISTSRAEPNSCDEALFSQTKCSLKQ